MASKIRISQKTFEIAESQRKWTFESRPGGWIIAQCEIAKGHVLKKRIALNQFRGKLSVQIGGWSWNGEWIQDTHGSQAQAASDADLTAQFPGKIRKILVQEGQKVEAGDPLVLVEAMKMEFKIKAPYAGVVKKILVKDGQNLMPGDRFLEIEK